MSTVQISAPSDPGLKAAPGSRRSHWIVACCRSWAPRTWLPRRLLVRGGGDE